MKIKQWTFVTTRRKLNYFLTLKKKFITVQVRYHIQIKYPLKPPIQQHLAKI